MKGKVVAVAVAVAALAISLLAGTAADAASLASAKRGGLAINFKLAKRHGKPTVVNFMFSGLPISCDEGDSSLSSGAYPDMRVNRKKRFHGVIDTGFGRVVARGKFKHHFRKAVGILRATGDFGEGPDLHNCASGVVAWKAGLRRSSGPGVGGNGPGRPSTAPVDDYPVPPSAERLSSGTGSGA
jgi:hypothetical protein